MVQYKIKQIFIQLNIIQNWNINKYYDYSKNEKVENFKSKKNIKRILRICLMY